VHVFMHVFFTYSRSHAPRPTHIGQQIPELISQASAKCQTAVCIYRKYAGIHRCICLIRKRAHDTGHHSAELLVCIDESRKTHCNLHQHYFCMRTWIALRHHLWHLSVSGDYSIQVHVAAGTALPAMPSCMTFHLTRSCICAFAVVQLSAV